MRQERAVTRAALDEQEAARIADAGSLFARTQLAVHAGYRLARDPKDTQQVFLLAAAFDRPPLLLLHRRMMERPAGRALLEERPSIDSRGVDYAWLRTLPSDTLGGAYVRSLDAQQLDPDLFQAPPALSPELAYVAKRVRQSHDIWHVLTGLGTDIPGEIALQAFTWAQIGGTTSRLLTLVGIALFGVRYPGLLRTAQHWYRVGKQSAFLLEVRWEDSWQEPLSLVRARVGLGGCSSSGTRGHS